MPRNFLVLFLAALAWAAPPASGAPPVPGAPPELVIYTYDSMVAPGGLGAAIFPEFEKKCGCKVRAVSSGDGGQLLSRLQIDARRGKPSAQIILGVDQQLWERIRPHTASWGDQPPQGYAAIPADLRVGEGFVPFDYGNFALMADRKALAGALPPRSLKELLDPRWKRKLILEDPRTSTPGLAFLLYSGQVLGKAQGKAGALEDFWRALKSQWLTLTPGWDEAYGLFLKGQAPLVWSYTTSQAYHREHGDREGRYEAVLFEEGQPRQIEGAALGKGSFHSSEERRRALSFLEFLISKEVQALIPKTNWMLPVRPGVALPESFRQLPSPRKIVPLPASKEAGASALAAWSRAVEIGHRD